MARSGQLARIEKTIRAQTVLAHCSGLSCGARRAPTGGLQRQQRLVQFAVHFVPYAGFIPQFYSGAVSTRNGLRVNKKKISAVIAPVT